MPAIELGKIISAVFRLSAPLPGSFYIEIHLKVDFYQLAALESKLQIYCMMSIRIRRLFSTLTTLTRLTRPTTLTILPRLTKLDQPDSPD